MRTGKLSLELIILVPVVVFLTLAGAGSYFLILNSVEEFARRIIRQSFKPMSDGIYSIADRQVDELSRVGKTEDWKATKIRHVTALIEIEDFARKNEIGIVIFSGDRQDAILVEGLHGSAASGRGGDWNPAGENPVLLGGHSYYSETFEFVPWNWQVILLKNTEAYEALLAKTRYFYVATAVMLILTAFFLIWYLRRTIAQPIHQIVARFRSGEAPAYKGIDELEFLSDSIQQMMREVADHRERLEAEVRERTAELERAMEAAESANSAVNDKNRMLEGLSSQLSKYLSPQIYSSIFSGKQSVEITSKRKKLTVCFADIADFTEITEKLESEDLSSALNHYLTEMSKIALSYGATIDKYIGDAMVLFFGDPESRGVKEDAVACVRMAIAMQTRMYDLHRFWRDRGIEQPFQMRIGINTGFCTVGNFGSEDRMDYTIIGNQANLAARLQAHADLGGILIAHETFELIKDVIAVEEQVSVSVKGFSRPVPCYRVIGSLDRLITEGRIVREFDEGVRIFLDLHRSNKEKVIDIVEGILARLKR